MSYFAFTIGFAGVSQCLLFIKEQSLYYAKVEGKIVGTRSYTEFRKRNNNHGGRYKTYIVPVIEYFWKGERYLTEKAVSYNYAAYSFLGPKVGDNVSLLVPLSEPGNAVENKFFYKNMSLIIGLFLLSISMVIVCLIVNK